MLVVSSTLRGRCGAASLKTMRRCSEELCALYSKLLSSSFPRRCARVHPPARICVLYVSIASFVKQHLFFFFISQNKHKHFCSSATRTMTTNNSWQHADTLFRSGMYEHAFDAYMGGLTGKCDSSDLLVEHLLCAAKVALANLKPVEALALLEMSAPTLMLIDSNTSASRVLQGRLEALRGESWLQQHMYEAAITALRRALELLPVTCAKERAACCAHIANIYRNRGHYQSAHAILEHAFGCLGVASTTPPEANKEAVNDNAEEATIPLYDQLALLFVSQVKFDAATEAARKSLEIRQKVFDATHPQIADAYVTLGKIKLARSHSYTARKLFVQSLEIRQAHFSKGHALLAESRHCLGDAAFALGDYLLAKKCYTSAHATRRALYGRNCFETCSSQFGQELCDTQLGGGYMALGVCKSVFNVCTRLLEPGHPYLFRQTQNLGSASLHLQEYASGLRYLRQAGRIARKLCDPGLHPWMAKNLDEIAHVYICQDKLRRAMACLLKAIAIREKLLERTHEACAASFIHIARLCAKTRDIDPALLSLKRGLCTDVGGATDRRRTRACASARRLEELERQRCLLRVNSTLDL